MWLVSVRPVKQTLSRIPSVQTAFEAAKERLRGAQNHVSLPSSLRAAAERIAHLEAENLRLKRESSLLLNQFVVWQYNAHMNGLTKEQLNRALPKVDLATTASTG